MAVVIAVFFISLVVANVCRIICKNARLPKDILPEYEHPPNYEDIFDSLHS
jgi:hypothetical protein